VLLVVESLAAVPDEAEAVDPVLDCCACAGCARTGKVARTRTVKNEDREENGMNIQRKEDLATGVCKV
jgi:hypothetical protein